MNLINFSTSFPLLIKELSELAYRRRTYVVRFVYTAILFVCGLLILYGRGGVSADPTQRLGEGQVMFQQLVWLQFAGIFMFLPAMSAGAFTNEKERDTLTLLLLTTMPPWTILAQKFLARVIPMLCFVILSFPLMAVAYSYGGVTTENLYGAMVLLTFAVLQVCAITLMCSAFCRTTVESFIASYLILLVSNSCFPIFTPLPLWKTDGDGAGVLVAQLFLVAFSTVAALAAARVFLLSRAFVPPRNILLELFQGLDRLFNDVNVVTGGVVLVHDGSIFPDKNPIAWRETSKKSLGTFRYLFRVLVVLELPILFVAQQLRLSAIQNTSAVSILLYGLWIIAVAMTCIHASSVVSAERSRQTLDSLLTTPITGRVMMIEKLVVDLSISVRDGVEGFEFDSGVRGRELPVGAALFFVAIRLPRRDFFVHRLFGGKAAIAQALAREQAQFHLGHIQPTSILGSEH